MVIVGRDPRGFSLVEVLVATMVTTVVTMMACALAMDAQVVARTDGARVDLQQRLRVGVDALARALREAGAGPEAGAGRGPLVRILPPIVPRRCGLRGADPVSTFRADAFTVIRAAGGIEQAVLAADAPAGSATFEIEPATTCALPACGFAVGTTAVVADMHGHHVVFTVTAAAATMLTVRHHGAPGAAPFPAGSPVIAVSQSVFAFDSAARTLREYDGDLSDQPLLDDVVGVEVAYFGDVQPPVWPRAAPAAANCLYDEDGSYRAVEMPLLAGTSGIVALTPAMLTDGPWCGVGASQFDADLLRIRRVRITLRLQAADPSLRGRDSRFRRPGTATRSGAMVADAAVTIDVAPRNLVGGG